MRGPVLLVLAFASSLALGRHCPRPQPKPTPTGSMPPHSEVHNPYYPTTVEHQAPAASTSTSTQAGYNTYPNYNPPAYSPPSSPAYSPPASSPPAFSPQPYSPPSTSSSSSSSSASQPTQSSGSSVDIGNSGPITGMSTNYGGNREGGTCSFSTYELPSWLYGTAFSGPAWDDAAHCGSCIKVTGPNGNTITAMIVDRCMECDLGHLDLFQNAFEQLGPLSAGIIQTSYTFVSCGITTPIVLHNKSGTSQYWFSMQVLNANEPVATLEVSTDGGATWQPTKRSFYNFFENQSGYRTPTVDVRVTSQTGKVITAKDVPVDSDMQITCGSNF